MRSQKWSGGDPSAMICGSSTPQISNGGHSQDSGGHSQDSGGHSQDSGGHSYDDQSLAPSINSQNRPKEKKKNDRLKNSDSNIHHGSSDPQVPNRQNGNRPNRYNNNRPAANRPQVPNDKNRRGTSDNDGRPWLNIRTNQSINFNLYSWIQI